MIPPVRPEQLKHRIRIQKKVTTRNEKLQPITDWQDVGYTIEKPEVFRWAKWVWLHGNEFFSAAAVESKTVADVTIRYIPNITADMSILYKDKRYGILPPVNNINEENKFITFKVFIIEPG